MANDPKSLEKAPQMTLLEVLGSYEGPFMDALAGNSIDFQSEIHFAYQALLNNSYLLSVAKQNPVSLKNAIINIGAIGLSLNPVSQLAYLVPRRINKQPAVCLDVSYKGLIRAATESGSILFAQAEIVYESEDVHIERITEPPIHKRKLFSKDKGEIVGAYVVVKTAHGDYLTTHMTIDEIFEIRNKSEAYKKRMGPWVDFESEMIKKTVVKRAAKMWPRTPKIEVLEKAIEVDNVINGLNFDEKREEVMETKEQLEEDFPRDPETVKFGPKFVAIWGKFRGKPLGDCDIESLDKYLGFLKLKVEKETKYQSGEKFETYEKIQDYLLRHGVYSVKAKDATLDELFSLGKDYDDSFIEGLSEGECQNLITGKDSE